jgi:hypothetical protein
MARRVALFALAACLAGLVGSSPAAAQDARLVALMTGAAERPGPGDPDGFGFSLVTIDDAANRICVTLVFANVTLPTSGFHIHFAPPTDPGPIVVRFSNPTRNFFRECVVEPDELILDGIAANPSAYYINLHTLPNYGPGAIRGQLRAV